MDAERKRFLKNLVERYAGPNTAASVWQLINSLVPFIAGWCLMLYSLRWGYWTTLLLAIPTTGFLVRLFIIQHDCGHGSFFRSRRVADAIGFLIGVMTLTPYGYWRKTHAIHHATSGNLDQRDFGDIETLTVREYMSLSRWRRLLYRLYRNPVVLLGVGPVWQFFIKHRLPFDLPLSWKREWASVIWTNLALAAVVIGLGESVGYIAFLKIQLPISLLAGTLGVWLFYVQHQFEDTYWQADGAWSYDEAALEGSSYFDLPRWLHFFTGNIGLHHIHHLSSRIPNYRLLRCHRENPDLPGVTRLTVLQGIKCLGLKLWDEEQRKLVGFRQLRRIRRTA